jgi:hypothetical protein
MHETKRICLGQAAKFVEVSCQLTAVVVSKKRSCVLYGW